MASHNVNVNFKIPLREIPGAELNKTRDPPRYGGFGDVWKYIWSTSSSDPPVTVAIKVVRVPDSSQMAVLAKIAGRIRREAYIWANLEDDHILLLHGITNDFGDLPAFVSSWMTQGSLDSYLQQRPTISTSRKLDMSRQIASGLKYLHEKGIVHGDLTPTNVLINSNNKLCLADFGLSMILLESGNSTFNSCHAGNVRWMAPEMLAFPDSEELESEPEPELQPEPQPQLESPKPTKYGDVYSHGCITLQLLCGQQPYFPLMDALHVTTAIVRGREPFRHKQLICVDEGHRQYLLTCLSTDFNTRPEVQAIIAFIEAELQKF